jgi:ribulose-bisphosphate carboxylase large chain
MARSIVCGSLSALRVSWITVTYRIRAPRDRLDDIAHRLALEQSVEVAAEVVTDPFVRENIVGRVAATHPSDSDSHLVIVELAAVTTGFDVAQTLNMLFGNSSLHAHVELVDVDFPPEFLAHFVGPRHGIDGIRRHLQVGRRPLTCAALKPQGVSCEALAALCYTLAANGVDVIKDDHGLADQSYSPFAQRVAACQRAIARAEHETGRRHIYAPSLVGSPQALAQQVRIARAEGVGAVLLAPALIGMPVFHELVTAHLDVPVIAHPAYAGAVRIAPPLLLGKLFRWLGADAVIFPNFGGRFAYTREECAQIAANNRGDWAQYRRTMPVAAGGLAVERVVEIVGFYGPDLMLLIGGALLADGDRLPDRTRAFVAATEAAFADAPAPHYAALN